jgi:dimethylamine monooxygenase subunit C
VLVSGIKSKPIYAPLRADVRGRYHLMLGLDRGAAALLRVLDELRTEAPELLMRTRVLFVPEGPGRARSATVERLQTFALAELRVFDDRATLLRDFRSVLEQSLMGTRLYVAGPESFIGLAMQIALQFNLNKDEIRAEELGTLARRVHCVHCRTTTENVTTNVVRCGGCERWLLVRDHYSRRLAAYMGVMVDAEVPGEVPAIKEVYP